jgi:hypothetical protein
MYWTQSNGLVLYIREEKGTSNIYPNPTLELLFAKKPRANRSKNASSLVHHASNNKNKIRAHPTDHGDAQFGPTLQPTNNPAALI